MNILLWICSIALILAGIAGTIIPALPGAPLVLGGFILAASLDNFQRVDWWTLSILIILTIATILIDFVASAMGAKRSGASGLAVAGATIGALIGIFFGFPGLLFGPFFGALVGELIAKKEMGQATKAGIGTWLGLLIGTAVKLTVIFLMIGIFVTRYLI
jgi:uncharacterized protein YqgC (DUF456 family)